MDLTMVRTLADPRVEIFADPVRTVAVKHESATRLDLKVELA